MSASRITKELSRKIATELTKPHRKLLSDKKEEIGNLLYKVEVVKIPKEVKKLFKSNPNYLDTSTYAYAIFMGKNYGQYKLTEKLPIPRNVHNLKIVLSESQDVDFNKLFTDEQELKDSADSLKKKLEGIIYSLRTYKNIKEALPEASKFLPEEGIKTEVLVNFKEIRQQLNIAN